jgi:hypothetical protein
MDNFALKNCVSDNSLTMLWANTGQPYHLPFPLSVYKNIGGELVTSDMGDKVDTHSARTLIVCITIQAHGPKMSFQLTLDEWGRYATAGISSFMRTE